MDTAEIDVDWLLNELNRYNRRPPWLNETEPDGFGPIDPIFLRDSVVCLAYRSAKRRALGSTRFDGQAKLRRKVQELDGATPDDKEAIVMKLSDIISPELRQEVMSWADKPQRKKRQCTSYIPCFRTHSHSSHCPGTRTRSESMSLQPPSSEIPTITHVTGTPTHESPYMQPTLGTPAPSADNGSPSVPRSSSSAHAQTSRSRHSFSTSTMSKARAVLSDDLFHALSTTYSKEQQAWVACIGVSYSNEDDCQITLDIHSRNIERFAERLFGVQLETDGGLRYIIRGNTQILPSPKAMIQGCKLDVIPPFFGPLLDEAVRESPIYAKDRMELSEYTRAVSMLVSHDANDVGVLVVHTNPCICAKIWDMLYIAQ
ncbi:hypothetical protein F5B18DRAFT_637474 [Nemania serpens]|nr:hypothetical protein F5B18DRAFT_637474 [Nemania serpens]